MACRSVELACQNAAFLVAASYNSLAVRSSIVVAVGSGERYHSNLIPVRVSYHRRLFCDCGMNFGLAQMERRHKRLHAAIAVFENRLKVAVAETSHRKYHSHVVDVVLGFHFVRAFGFGVGVASVTASATVFVTGCWIVPSRNRTLVNWSGMIRSPRDHLHSASSAAPQMFAHHFPGCDCHGHSHKHSHRDSHWVWESIKDEEVDVGDKRGYFVECQYCCIED